MEFTKPPYLAEPPMRDINHAMSTAERLCSANTRKALKEIHSIEAEHYYQFGESDHKVDMKILQIKIEEQVPDYVNVQAELHDLTDVLMSSGNDGCSTPVFNIPKMITTPPPTPPQYEHV